MYIGYKDTHNYDYFHCELLLLPRLQTPTQGYVDYTDFQTESQTIQNRNEIFFTLVKLLQTKGNGQSVDSHCSCTDSTVGELL